MGELVERNNGQKAQINPIFMGPANRKWSCWVVGSGEGQNRSAPANSEDVQRMLGGKLVLTVDKEEEEGATSVSGSGRGMGMRPSTGGEVKGLFTPVATAGSW